MAHANALGDLQPNPTRANHTQDGSRTRIAFKEIQRLSQHDGRHLRQNPEADTKQAPGAGGRHTLCLALFGVFDGFRIKLRQDPDI